MTRFRIGRSHDRRDRKQCVSLRDEVALEGGLEIGALRFAADAAQGRITNCSACRTISSLEQTRAVRLHSVSPSRRPYGAPSEWW